MNRQELWWNCLFPLIINISDEKVIIQAQEQAQEQAQAQVNGIECK